MKSFRIRVVAAVASVGALVLVGFPGCGGDDDAESKSEPRERVEKLLRA